MDTTIPFRGFLVRAEDPSGTAIGAFTPTNEDQQLLDCSEVDSSIPAEVSGDLMKRDDDLFV